MGKYFVIILTIGCIVILVYGQLYWKNINASLSVEGKKVIEERIIKQQAEREELVNSLKPENNRSQSLIDFLRYKKLTENNVTVITLGSNITAGIGANNAITNWQDTLQRKIKLENADLETLKIINQGYEGYSTTDLITGGKLDLVINTKPDVIIFESMIITNYNRAISLEQTTQDLETIMSTLLKEVENVKIIVTAPNPIINSENINRLGLNYQQYVEKLEEVVNKNNWTYFDSIAAFERKLKDSDILMVDILASDDIHLSYEGYLIWVEVLYEYLKG